MKTKLFVAGWLAVIFGSLSYLCYDCTIGQKKRDKEWEDFNREAEELRKRSEELSKDIKHNHENIDRMVKEIEERFKELGV